MLPEVTFYRVEVPSAGERTRRTWIAARHGEILWRGRPHQTKRYVRIQVADKLELADASRIRAIRHPGVISFTELTRQLALERARAPEADPERRKMADALDYAGDTANALEDVLNEIDRLWGLTDTFDWPAAFAADGVAAAELIRKGMEALCNARPALLSLASRLQSKLVDPALPALGAIHGTVDRYTAGCRCDLCAAANSAEQRTQTIARRRRRGGYYEGNTWHPFSCECPKCLP